MRTAFVILFMLALPSTASQLGMVTVKQPTYLHESDTDAQILIIDVPFVTRNAHPEWVFSAICQPFVPSSDNSWKKPHDVNLASIYQIKVSGAYKDGTRDVEVTIDITEAKAPDGYPFTIDQVVDSVATCVKLMFPPKPEAEGNLAIRVKR